MKPPQPCAGLINPIQLVRNQRRTHIGGGDRLHFGARASAAVRLAAHDAPTSDPCVRARVACVLRVRILNARRVRFPCPATKRPRSRARRTTRVRARYTQRVHVSTKRRRAFGVCVCAVACSTATARTYSTCRACTAAHGVDARLLVERACWANGLHP